MKTGAELIAAERQRQIDQKGWDSKHDDGHQYGDLAVHAAALAVNETDAAIIDPLERVGYPNGESYDARRGAEHADAWGLRRKHGDNPIRALTIAGALIAAEIDRLQRLEGDPSE